MEEKTFGERLTERMRAQSMDKTLVAYLMGVPVALVEDWMRCSFAPDPPTTIRLARVLWCWPWELDTHMGESWRWGCLS